MVMSVLCSCESESECEGVRMLEWGMEIGVTAEFAISSKEETHGAFESNIALPKLSSTMLMPSRPSLSSKSIII